MFTAYVIAGWGGVYAFSSLVCQYQCRVLFLCTKILGTRVEHIRVSVYLNKPCTRVSFDNAQRSWMVADVALDIYSIDVI